MIKVSLKKNAVIATALLSVLCLGAAVYAKQKLYDKIVAVVDKKVITFRQAAELMEPYRQKWESKKTSDERIAARQKMYLEILDILVGETLIDSEVEKAKIKITDDEVDAAIKKMMEKNEVPDLQTFKERIEKGRGESFEDFKEWLTTQIKRQRFLSFKIGRQVKVDEDEIKAEYKTIADNEAKKLSCDFTLISISADTNEKKNTAALRIIQGFKKGSSLADALAMIKDKKLNAEKGLVFDYQTEKAIGAIKTVDGKQEAFSLDGQTQLSQETLASTVILRFSGYKETTENLRKEYVEACSDAEEGAAYAKPLKVADNVFAFILNSKQKGEPPDYDKLRDKLFNEIYSRRVDQMTNRFIEGLKSKAVIRIIVDSPDEFFDQ